MKKRRDMHPADILAAFKKRQTSLAALSRQAGLNSGTLANALKRPWPKGEFIIAAALGVHPSAIWPSRYYDSRGLLLARERRLRRSRAIPPAADAPETEENIFILPDSIA
ncbi:helix-turn-helix domain-containing protein [Erwinia pyrifoliae]|uniref:Helix-turn-helix domain-containing protein n=1 Tax=Erwinia pyrifoliae TaxID=79967 RepID=A0ABY5X9G5_ERWPY|nr:helix-turn-helix transcriptional regulator [Erwinia pyrifoliae]AUX73981.1 sugar fermentation stimulation protein [Erwinia pyrifoliae]MCA8875680.1 transcriptional regulator [Erwinia pyrifoliae]MCT2385885.1 helix-turn-helix domain-containing protein [Erwinia pyrifoliae]MCU8588538.1 helix-turn-helix domain-containing protein [Erwinia pyrifoliae]UWS29721.1 helix-turn-helix domain-containing protein [Erwinia pyrifoliae]